MDFNQLMEMLGVRAHSGAHGPVAAKLIEKYGAIKADHAIQNISHLLSHIKRTEHAKIGASFSISDGLQFCCESQAEKEDKFFFLFMLATMNIMVAREAKARLVEINWTAEQMKIFYDGIQLLAQDFIDNKDTSKMLLFTGDESVSGSEGN